MPKLPSTVSAPTAKAIYNPCRRADRAASRSPEPRACETRTEMAVENPRPTMNGTYKTLLAKVAAANGTTPSRPTMMRATLESTTDGILVTDYDGQVTGYNQQFVEMWRLQPEVFRAD